MKAISTEVRKMIKDAKDRGEKECDIARWTGVSVRSIARIHCLSRENLEPKHRSGRPGSLTDDHLLRIRKAINEQSDITLEELIEQLDLPVKKSRLSEVLIDMDLPFKKRLYTRKRSNAKTL